MLSQSAILDCRHNDDFRHTHHRASGHVPFDELFERMHELPTRQTSLILIGDEESLPITTDFLIQRGYQISKSIHWNHDVAKTLEQYDLLETGNGRQQLWQPSPLIKHFTTASDLSTYLDKQDITPTNGLDIGCGAGRDAVFLAMHGWSMTGIDHHKDALERCHLLATSNQVEINTLQRNLETQDNALADITDESIGLICTARYLHRPLFEQYKRILKSGGVVLYQTFMQGCEHLGGPRNPAFLLAPDELKQTFSASEGFTIVLDEIDFTEDYRPISSFMAIKN